MSMSPVDAAWSTYGNQKDPAARAQLIERYAPLVKYVAGRLSTGLPSHVSMDDLYSEGLLGLIDAIEKFDPSRGVKFETYAVARIKGAILDGLRRMDWLPVHTRQKIRQLEKAYSELQSKLNRFPSDAEVAAYLGMDMKAFHELLQNASIACTISLEDSWFESDRGGLDALDFTPDPSAPDPLSWLELEAEKEDLMAAIDSLPEREKLIIALYYYEGLTLREIAEVLQVSVPRVSQLHARAVLYLRAKLLKLWETR
ncbi:MAG TPA: FliA/WhiG family RNA polymerase sigma factor [Firmicutes bacterium]|nr:FliA/WhiG family RNA polymerase sigma factor [Bacillota bacterium]